MRTIFIFLGTLTFLLLIGEVGQRYTNFNKAGDFILVFFYCSIISGIITGCNHAWYNNKSTERLREEAELTRAQANKAEIELKRLEFNQKHYGTGRNTP